jgi:flagellar motor protein MotB
MSELTFEKVWGMFQEIAEQSKETDKKFQEIAEQSKETDKKFQEIAEQSKETDKKFQEIAEQSKETDKKFQEIAEQSKETDKKFQETDRQFKEAAKQSRITNKAIEKSNKLFNGQWGKLIESLVEGDLVKLLNAKGIKVERTYQRAVTKYEGKDFELDIIAENGIEVVIVEVKTTLEVDHVKWFLEKLNKFKEVFPKYKPNTVYGAMAYLKTESEATTYAMKQGLYVIRATGDSSRIINTTDFQPKVF